MPLKQLEIDNFKSYRGKQIVGPFSAFSAVIGPNGSGKSNLMDAISFVLGVRGAQIRSSELSDLIYSRNLSQGDTVTVFEDDAPSKASVTAVIEDANHMEHRFQRIVTATGASEYRYNGRMTTQASYNAKLEQLNILVKARNFLVFQGDVEAFAEQCSKDLSEVIDQISGSKLLQGEYEAAKSAYQEAVDHSAALVAKRKTLQGELRHMRQHKEASDRYDVLKNELSSHIVQKMLWRLYHIHEIIEIHTDWIEAHATRGEQARKRLEDKEGIVAAARTELGKVQQAVLDKENEKKQTARLLDAKRPEKDRLVERAEHARRKLQQAQSLYKQAEKDHTVQAEALNRLEADKVLVEKALVQAKEAQEAALATTTRKLSDEELQMYHALKAQSAAIASDERTQLEQIQRERREKQTALDTVQDRLDDAASKLERLEEQEALLAASAMSLEQREPEAAEKVKEAKAALEQHQAQKEDIAAREKELNDVLVLCYNKLLRMGQDQRVHEREMRLRESIRSLRSIFPGVHGRLLDLCKPTQKKYEIAMATTLGRNTEAVVVDHESTAMECIEYLRNQRAGQATFIPLDTIQTKPINDRLRSVSPQARLAVDVMQYSPAVERAVHFACGNTLICDTLDVARNVCFEKNQRVKAVTLDGTVIHKTGMMTGGPSMQDSVRQWDEQEMLGVQRERDRCMSELKELQQQKYTLGEEEEAVAKITRAQAALSNVHQEQADVARRRKDIAAERSTLEAQQKALTVDVHKHNTALTTLATRLTELETFLAQVDDKHFAAFCERIGVANVREYESQQLALTQALDMETEQYQRQLARLAHQRTFTLQQEQNTAERLAYIQAAIDKETKRLPALEQEMAACDREMASLRAQLEQMQSDWQALRDQHREKSDALHEKRKALIATSRDVDAHRKEVAERNDEIAQLDLERTNLYRQCRLETIDLPLESGDLANVALEDEAPLPAVDGDDAVQPIRPFDVVVDFSRLSDAERTDRGSTKARELQDKIDMAREEMAKLNPSTHTANKLEGLERELQTCERDMDSCREHVRETREELQHVKKQRTDKFMRAYNHIAERIDGVYKDLTKSKAAPMGGVAYLTLEDTDEPFRTGIRYHAMPPMKRFRDMDQLSGGEKTMAALSLLFAIHTYQPAPFFVLDEVDAALDSQNVARVSEYIREHASDQFQFIVISLKASLYERSQGLVGVYRNQAANSSAIVTLDLESYA